MKVNLGCPRYCEGWVCVDIYPADPRVVAAEATSYIAGLHPSSVAEVKAENLLEHLPNVHQFLKGCFDALEKGGRITIVTDNAEWLPFYLPFEIPRLGVGAHAVKRYALRFNTVHFSIFSPMHLLLHLSEAGFAEAKVRRLVRYAFARLEGSGYKRGG